MTPAETAGPPEPAEPGDGSSEDGAGERRVDPVRRRAQERRRLAEIFGDVLPDSTGDDRDQPGRGEAAASRDEELRRNVPPHH